jgi:phage-related baseplate assembly protein
MSESLGEAFPKEQERLRELLQAYRDIGPAGAFGYMAISAVAKRADEAAISGDPVAMLRAYQEMKGCE